MSSIASKISRIEVELVGLKAASNSRADSANWHKLVIDFDTPATTDKLYRFTIRVVPLNKGIENLIVSPEPTGMITYSNPEYEGQHYPEYDFVGNVIPHPTDPCKFFLSVHPYGGSVVRAGKIVLYSNYELALVEMTRDTIV